jgi:hypothetical protein
MEFETVEGVIIHIWNKYSTELSELGICADLMRVKDNYELCVYHNNAKRNIKFKHLEKKEGCESCKEKVTKVTHIFNKNDIFYPTPEEVYYAFNQLRDRLGGDKEFVSKVYRALFNEEFNYNCGNCKNMQSARLRQYIVDVLKITI